MFASAEPSSWGIVKNEEGDKKEEQNHNQNEIISMKEIDLKDDVSKTVDLR